MRISLNLSICLSLATVLGLPNMAEAEIYMQQNIDNEIVLTNLAPDADPAYTASDNDHDGSTSDNKHDGSKRYILLVEDDLLPSNEKFPTKITGNSPSKLIADAVTSAARQTSVEPALLHAVIRVESNYNPNALSPQGARGLMQLMPGTAKRFNVHNAYDPKQNILAGAQYLRELQTLFKGNIQLVLAAYNAGPNAVAKYGFKIPPYLETRLYVPKVLGVYQQLRLETW
jgi:hypothetical protein